MSGEIVSSGNVVIKGGKGTSYLVSQASGISYIHDHATFSEKSANTGLVRQN